jgi:hypothetical protein
MSTSQNIKDFNCEQCGKRCDNVGRKNLRRTPSGGYVCHVHSLAKKDSNNSSNAEPTHTGDSFEFAFDNSPPQEETVSENVAGTQPVEEPDHVTQTRVDSMTQGLVSLPFSRPAFSHSVCFICKATSSLYVRLSTITNESIADVFFHTGKKYVAFIF